MATGLWQDTVYSACRCKAQRLRRNIDEIASWPDLQCHHTHAADEWQPYLQNGQRVFPSKEEAEYTASLAFSIAVSASWWAARVKLAKLHVPRFPFVETAQAGALASYRPPSPPGVGNGAYSCLFGASSDSPGRASQDPTAAASRGCHLRGQDPATCVRLCGMRPPQPSSPSYQMQLSVCPRPQLRPFLLASVMQHLAGDLPELTGCVLACDCEMDMVCA